MITIVITAQITAANTLLIWQIGAATDGNISHSFVELYNAANTAVNLDGYSLQYAAGTKVSANATQDGAWKKIDLSGTILPKHSFLILGKKGTTTNPALLIENNYGDINDAAFELSNRAVKVALMSNTIPLDVNNPFDIDGLGAKAGAYAKSH